MNHTVWSFMFANVLWGDIIHQTNDK